VVELERQIPSQTGLHVDLEHPWLGLDSYGEEHRLYFFGRNAEADELLLRVQNNPLTILYGRSGLGKTSLLRAGLLPRLREDRASPIRVRLDYTKQVLLSGRETSRPAAQLLAELFPQPQPPLPGNNLPTDALSQLWLHLHRNDYPRPCTHLILDQFEEIFTLGAALPGADMELRDSLMVLIEGFLPDPVRAFLNADRSLVAHYQLNTLPLPVLLALRAEFVFVLNRWRRHLPALGSNHFELLPLRGLAALDAVYEPGALRTHYRQEGDKLVESPDDADPRPIIPIEIARRLVRDLSKASGDTPLENISAVPPLLSVVCKELNAARFAQIDGRDGKLREQIAAIGESTDPNKILGIYYEQSFAGRPPGVRRVIEDQLLSGDGYRQPRTPEFLCEEFVKNAVPAGEAEKHLDALLDRRLLTTNDQIPDQTRYEIIHDVLCPIVAESKAKRRIGEAAEQRLKEAQTKASKQAMVFAIVCLTLLLVGAGVSGWIFYSKSNEQANLRAKSDVNLASLYLTAATEPDTPENIASAMAAVSQVASSSNTDALTNDARMTFLDLLLRTNWMLPLCELSCRPARVNFANLSPDGSIAVTVSNDKLARLWSVPDGKLLQALPHRGSVASAAFSPDGSKLVTASSANAAYLWKSENGAMKLQAELPHHGPVWSARFSPDATKVVTASDDKTATIWNAENGKILFSLEGHIGPVTEAYFSPDGSKIATASEDKTARIWDAATGKRIAVLEHGGKVTDVRFNPDSKTRDSVVTACADNNARIWALSAKDPSAKQLRHEDGVNTACFDSVGKTVLTSSVDGTARLWDTETGSEVFRMKHKNAVWSASFSPSSPLLMTATQDGNAYLWNLNTRRQYSFPLSHNNPVRYAEFSRGDDPRVITTTPEGNSATVWDIRLGMSLPTILTSLWGVSDISFDHTGSRFAKISPNEKSVTIQDNISGHDVQLPTEYSVRSVAMSPDGKNVLAITTTSNSELWRTERVKVWNIDDPQRPPVQLDHGEPVYFAKFSSDGSRIVTLSRHAAYIWDWQKVSPLTPIRLDHPGSTERLRAADLNKDGTKLAVAAGTSIWLWDLGRRTRIGEPTRNYAEIYTIRFSKDGTKLVTSSRDGLAKVWDVAHMSLLSSLPHGDASVFCAAFSPDGEKVATGTNSGAVIWNWRSEHRLTNVFPSSGFGIFAAEFDDSCKKLFTGSANDALLAWDLGNPERMVDERLIQIAEAISGKGEMKSLQSLAQLRTQGSPANTSANDSSHLADWSLAERSKRTVSPFSHMTSAQYIENLIADKNNISFLVEAYQLDPSNKKLREAMSVEEIFNKVMAQYRRSSSGGYGVSGWAGGY
jgi:WD40 repeat protein